MKMENIEKLVPDTSIIIEGVLSQKIEKKEFKVDEIIIHEAVLSELEHQANQGKSIGTIGLEEIKKLKELAGKLKFNLHFSGRRPNPAEIKHASLGEVDSLIRDLAYDEDATLLTGDKVQSKVAEAKGMKIIYIEPVIKSRKLKLDKFFDKETMSVHLRENLQGIAKKGLPGNWQFVYITKEKFSQDEIYEISKEIIEEAKIRKDGFIEVERRGSTIVQLGDYRIVITRPPLSDGWEVTAVRPVAKLNLNEYKLSEKLITRITESAEGILIAGSPGMGKTTFATALAEFYANKNKIVKTIEAPRDLQLGDNITQYSISHGTSQEIHDILLLTRPDYTIFDEMRNTEDFKLFADLRLSGIGLVGVLHSTNPIDAIQRFIGRIELGVIPQVVDTVLFIKNGQVFKVLSLAITVKVPSGMTEEDLARPVVEVKDFETNELESEIYSYGEETVVIPVQTTKRKTSGAKELAAKQIERELRELTNAVKAEVVSDHKAIIYVAEDDIARIIGKQGKNMEKIEQKLGINLEVRSIHEKDENQEIKLKVEENKHFIEFYVDESLIGEHIDFYLDDKFLFTGIVGKKCSIKISKKSQLGLTLIRALDTGQKISLRI